MKLCIDCKWSNESTGLARSLVPECRRPGVGRKDPVDGYVYYPSCSIERLFWFGGCGRRARHFQPKP